jgi:DprA winged helix domain
VASPHEKKILRLLEADESTHIDQMVELLESEMSSSEIIAALFELELNGEIRQLPERISCQSSVKSGGGRAKFSQSSSLGKGAQADSGYLRRARRFLGKKCTASQVR